jgi:hypothetical protein
MTTIEYARVAASNASRQVLTHWANQNTCQVAQRNW